MVQMKRPHRISQLLQNAQKRKDPHTLEEIPDDTDDLEDEAEIQAWKEREFRRIMRAREKEEQRKQVEACGESEE